MCTSRNYHWHIRWSHLRPSRNPGTCITDVTHDFFSWVVLRAAEGGEGLPWKILQNKTWVSIGKISYGIYVFHFAVHYLFEPKLRALFTMTNAWTDIGTAITLMLISTALAAMSWRYFEEPINQYRRRF